MRTTAVVVTSSSVSFLLLLLLLLQITTQSAVAGRINKAKITWPPSERDYSSHQHFHHSRTPTRHHQHQHHHHFHRRLKLSNHGGRPGHFKVAGPPTEAPTTVTNWLYYLECGNDHFYNPSNELCCDNQIYEDPNVIYGCCEEGRRLCFMSNGTFVYGVKPKTNNNGVKGRLQSPAPHPQITTPKMWPLYHSHGNHPTEKVDSVEIELVSEMNVYPSNEKHHVCQLTLPCFNFVLKLLM